MRLRIHAVLGALALVVLGVAAEPAVAGGGGHGVCAGFTRGAVLSVQDNCFQGTAHIVERDSTLTVTNHGQVTHDFTAADGTFASGLLQPGQSYELAVRPAGAIPFYCSLHGTALGSGMAGVLFVEEAASPAGTLRSAAQGRATTVLADRAATDSSPIANTAVDNSAPVYLAAAALVLSILALAVVIPLVRRPRRET